MSVSSVETIERSEPLINDLIQSRAEMGWHEVPIPDLVGQLAVPTFVCDPRGTATQLIVIAGGAASGKSTLAEDMSRELLERDALSAIISSDDFVLWDRGERHRREKAGMLPEEKYDFGEMRKAIGAICANQYPGRTVEVPQYDSHSGLAIDAEHRRHIPNVDVLIVEGDMLGERGARPQDLYSDRTFKPLTIYTHAPDQVRLARRVERDMVKRNKHGGTPQDIIDSFEYRQTMQHFPFTLPYASAADIILIPSADGVQTYDMYDFRL